MSKLVDTLLAAISDPNKSSASNYLTQGLTAVTAHLDTPHIVRLLQHPLAAGPAQRALLEQLEQRTRRSFRRPWHFIDQTSANGVDRLAAPPRGDASLTGR